MALHLTLAEHDADPPESWQVQKHGRRWRLVSSSGATLDTFDTKGAALAARHSGFIASLYEKEGRWFRGESIPGWKMCDAAIAKAAGNS